MYVKVIRKTKCLNNGIKITIKIVSQSLLTIEKYVENWLVKIIVWEQPNRKLHRIKIYYYEKECK